MRTWKEYLKEAKKEIYKRGTKFKDSKHKTELIVQDYDGDGYNVRVWQGNRQVGDVSKSQSDLDSLTRINEINIDEGDMSGFTSKAKKIGPMPTVKLVQTIISGANPKMIDVNAWDVEKNFYPSTKKVKNISVVIDKNKKYSDDIKKVETALMKNKKIKVEKHDNPNYIKYVIYPTFL